MEIVGRDTPYQAWLDVVRLHLRIDGGTPFVRHVVRLWHAVSVLPYDPERQTALVIETPRAPLLHMGHPGLVEAIAGAIDRDAAPEAVARAEALEEAGVRLDDLAHVGHVWTTPGATTERLDYFLARYTAADRIGTGGGLAHEDEHIVVHERSLVDLWALTHDPGGIDGKLMVLLQALRLREPDLFA
ncbi:ADP-ribose pyrophosphatase [Sphingomonas spermidinifaciens]|uniref:GDP-mannose pyrophosphatase n=1 Tax=Sphingomonas spermidinifaciens TaxID=1141889 RepID=A0A2A4B1L6_9SPHN|nr:ADP-ribose pyrophosphatase [Sphingomonas spermidinifaciens]